jgi:hypothetical protein
MNRHKSKRKSQAANRLMKEMHEMLSDIAASATVLGHTPFDGVWACRELAESLHTALLEFEIKLAEIGQHSFNVRKG